MIFVHVALCSFSKHVLWGVSFFSFRLLSLSMGEYRIRKTRNRMFPVTVTFAVAH